MAASACCSYSTQRFVRLRDWKLGAIYWLLTLAIVSYIIFDNILVQQLYRKQGAVIGSARIQLRPPEARYSVPAANTSYCGSGPGAPFNIPFQRYPCRFLDNYDAVYPSTESAAVLLSTRITELQQVITSPCEQQPVQSCQYTTVNTSTYYVADVEYFTALIDHLMTAPSLGIARSASDMTGSLVDHDGNTVNPCDDYTAYGMPCPAYVQVGRQGLTDILPMRTLLRAAGIASLDQRSGSVPALANETLRYSGFVIVLSIQYSNYFEDTYSWNEQTVNYRYQAVAVPDAEFKAEEVDNAGEETGLSRLIVDRHGFRVVIAQSGTVGAYDTAVLLLTLTASVGLLAVAKGIVDFLASSVLPQRQIYSAYMMEDSIDLSHMDADAGTALVAGQPRTVRYVLMAEDSDPGAEKQQRQLQQEVAATSAAAAPIRSRMSVNKASREMLG